MYEPKIANAYQMLQLDVEIFFEKHGLTYEKVETEPDWFREHTVYEYSITDENGNDMGSVFYKWGTSDIVESKISDDTEIKDVFEKEFSDIRERFSKYVEEYREYDKSIAKAA